MQVFEIVHMDILLATDNNFTLPTGVLMTSISLNSGEPVRYHILVDDAFSVENRAKLLREAALSGEADLARKTVLFRQEEQLLVRGASLGQRA